MADKHDRLLSIYRQKLLNKKYNVNNKNPFVDYRPDIFATKDREKIIVEVEVEQTIHSDHTLKQLLLMHTYLMKKGKNKGILVVPKKVKREASLLIKSVFGDDKIMIVGI